jgi:hypothetical protein
VAEASATSGFQRSVTGSSRWPSSSCSSLFEADFYPSSYGYRPARRAQDAIAEIVHFAQDPSAYEWVIEADIEACFDRIDHGQLSGRPLLRPSQFPL